MYGLLFFYHPSSLDYQQYEATLRAIAAQFNQEETKVFFQDYDISENTGVFQDLFDSFGMTEIPSVLFGEVDKYGAITKEIFRVSPLPAAIDTAAFDQTFIDIQSRIQRTFQKRTYFFIGLIALAVAFFIALVIILRGNKRIKKALAV